MLQVSDVRETRVFQEALEEGLEKGLEKGREEGREEIVLAMLKRDLPLKEIATMTGLSTQHLRKLKQKLDRG